MWSPTSAPTPRSPTSSSRSPCSTWASPAALRAAGLQNKVHTIVNVGESTNYQYIESGQTQAAVAFNNIENAWAQADGLARHFTGQSMQVTQDAQLPFMLIDKDNLISTKTQFPLVEDYQAQFKKLWGKS